MVSYYSAGRSPHAITSMSLVNLSTLQSLALPKTRAMAISVCSMVCESKTLT